MANYIITKDQNFFQKIGDYNYCNLEDMVLPDTIAYDSETTSLKPILGDIFAIQLGTGENNYLIHCYDNNYGPKDVIPYLEGKTLIGHNLLFDLGFLYKYGFYPTSTKDTFIASKLLYNGIMEYRHDFGAVFYRELGIIYDKTEQKNIHSVKLSTQTSIQYCFNDVDRLIELHNFLENKLYQQGYKETYDLHCKHIQALAYIEQCGVPLSEKAWLSKVEKDKEVKKEKELQVIEYIYNNLPQFRDNQIDMFDTSKRLKISISSAKQMIDVFKELKINIITSEGKESIGEDIINKSSHEFVKIWLEYQSASHDVSTFGQNILDKVIQGRIYSTYNPILDTARISTRRGDINTLNLPANQRTRECIEAKEGFQMIVSDYAGQENIVGADISGDEMMIASVVQDLDLHCAFARVLYSEELQDLSDEEIIKDHKSKRNSAKAPRFLFAYGGNAFTLHQNEGIPIERAQQIENSFKELHSGLYETGNKKLQEATKLGYIESALGFKLHLPYYKEYKELETKIQAITKDDWDLYKIGKKEYREQFRKKELKEDYVVINQQAYNFYKNNKSNISKYFKLKSQYMRLCLNNPVQATSAHQTKQATIALFNFIKKNNHIGKAKIVLVVHDEIVMEVEDNLTELYKQKLGEIMVTEGNKFIKNPILTIKADANVGKNWYLAK
jgi:DNA polymerase-1